MDRLLTADDFEPHVGKTFRFRGTRHAFPLHHISRYANTLPADFERQPFTLIFRGPKEADVLPEGLYECEVEEGPTFRLYVIPIYTPRHDCQDYQSVFN